MIDVESSHLPLSHAQASFQAPSIAYIQPAAQRYVRHSSGKQVRPVLSEFGQSFCNSESSDQTRHGFARCSLYSLNSDPSAAADARDIDFSVRYLYHSFQWKAMPLPISHSR